VITAGSGEQDIYGSLIRFCLSEAGLGLREGVNFYPFPYDWRKDNALSADDLAQRIRELDPSKEKQVYLIAHSMEGLVCRIMLNRQPEILRRTRLFFQIASPVEGSPKAFWTLNKYPEFSTFIDLFYLRKHLLNPDRRAQLLVAVQSCASLFQLLPPRHINTLIGPGGAEYPAVCPDAWPMQLHSQLAKAESIQSVLDVSAGIAMRSIYSGQHPTMWRFAVDRFWTIMGMEKKPDGDETVPASSARARSSGEVQVEVKGELTEHTALCRNPEVHRLLKEAICDRQDFSTIAALASGFWSS
jgi:pimeloyl-ACP methyl ester carboxylesterase